MVVVRDGVGMAVVVFGVVEFVGESPCEQFFVSMNTSVLFFDRIVIRSLFLS